MRKRWREERKREERGRDEREGERRQRGRSKERENILSDRYKDMRGKKDTEREINTRETE